MPLKVKKETVNFAVDEHPRPQTTLEGLKKLPTLFKENGLVTAGSASVSLLFLKYLEAEFLIFCREFVMEPALWFWQVKKLCHKII